MALKDNIKRFRVLRNLSVQELADKMTIGKANIYNWESGTNKPDIDSLTALSKALDTSINDLLGEDITPVQKGSDNTEIPLGEDKPIKLDDIIEGNSHYSIVPNTLISGEYRMILDRDITWRMEIITSLMDAKNETIRDLRARLEKMERERDELRSGPRSEKQRQK